MKVLVTGASGFIGQSLVGRLLAAGHTVRALYRREKIGPVLEDLALGYPHTLILQRFDLAFPQSMPERNFIDDCYAESRQGIPIDIPEWDLDQADLSQAGELLRDTDACVHIAARVGDWGSNEDFFAANVNPLALLLAAAEKNGLRRFVYVSSISVHGFGHSRGSTESGPYFWANNPYQLSKRCGEALVNAACRRGLDACIIRPGNVYGPGDTTTFYPIFDALQQGLMGTLSGGRYLTCPVYIDDLVSAFMAALGPINGKERTFNITSGERITWRQLVDESCDALNIRRSSLDMPGFLARTAAFVMEGSFKMIRSPSAPPLTNYRVEQLLHDYHFSNQSAKLGLDYEPRMPINQGLRATASAWRQARGLDGGGGHVN